MCLITAIKKWRSLPITGNQTADVVLLGPSSHSPSAQTAVGALLLLLREL